MFGPQYYTNPSAYPGMMGSPTTMQMQQRFNQMEQQYPQFAQQGPMPQGFQQQPVYMKCRAVTSIDEAKAAMIDLDGSLHVFTDVPHKRIYTKQINLDGTASLNVYTLEEPGSATQAGPVVSNSAKENLVPESIFNRVVNSLQKQINDLQEKFEQRGEMNVQSNANAQSKNRKTKANDASYANDGQPR